MNSTGTEMTIVGGNGSIMVGMFVCLCLASQKPSEREFFVPARMDLSVKLLSDMGSTLDLNLTLKGASTQDGVTTFEGRWSQRQVNSQNEVYRDSLRQYLFGHFRPLMALDYAEQSGHDWRAKYEKQHQRPLISHHVTH